MLLFNIDARLLFIILLIIIISLIEYKTRIFTNRSCSINGGSCGTLRNYFIIVIIIVLVIGLRLLS